MVETNKLRHRALKRDAVLEKKAQAWADYLTGGIVCKYDHQNPLPRMSRAENIAATGGKSMTGKSVVAEQWGTSYGHRKNMLNEGYSRMGVGIGWGCKMQGMDGQVAVALYA